MRSCSCVLACALLAFVNVGRAEAQTTCASMAGASLPNVRITSAQTVDAGAFQPPGGRGGGGRGGAAFAALQPFCRVAATLTPTPQSNISVEVWLPASGWNGRLQVVGNGAFAGTISYPAMATAVASGYATASTDTGHTGAAANTFVNQDVLVDFAHRAIHETTAFAKLVVARVYGKPQEFAYFNGCSTGGRQALTAAQRYPADFDGIVAGAPATLTSSQVFSQVLVHQALSAPDAALPREALELLSARVLAACDAADGAADGVLEQPLGCRFDPQVLACRDGSRPGTCLTSAQVEAARRVYTGALNPRTGASIFPGLERGSELGWSPAPIGYAVDWLKYVFKDPAWDPKTLNFDADVAKVTAREFQVLDANDPDLDAFVARGGKLLMYQGWAEPGIPPRNIVRYFGDVQKQTTGSSQAVRLFMVPGMGHCGGGNGTSTFDMVAALDTWKRSGAAPESIPASRVRNGVVDRTRPLCAYPKYARYKGSGGIEDAASFACSE